MKHLSFLLILGITESSCGAERPQITMCAIDGIAELLHCTDKNGKLTHLTCREANDYVCSPDLDAEKMKLYVIDLEKENAKLKSQCR